MLPERRGRRVTVAAQGTARGVCRPAAVQTSSDRDCRQPLAPSLANPARLDRECSQSWHLIPEPSAGHLRAGLAARAVRRLLAVLPLLAMLAALALDPDALD